MSMDVQLPEEPDLKIRVWTHLLTQLIRGSSWVHILGCKIISFEKHKES